MEPPAAEMSCKNYQSNAENLGPVSGTKDSEVVRFL